MNDMIKKCKKCELWKNQAPLLDYCEKTCDIMWVGLSAKQIKDAKYSYPLADDTNSGKLIYEIEEMMPSFSFYKTNLVKCLPLNSNRKLRYPTKTEIEKCIPNLIEEIETLKPKIIFLLGSLVAISFNRYIKKHPQHCLLLEKTKVFEVKHPSYIASYRIKNIASYKEDILNLIYSSEGIKV